MQQDGLLEATFLLTIWVRLVSLTYEFEIHVYQVLIISFLLQESHNCPLSAAVSLCNPFDLVIADEDFHKGFNNVYDKALSRSLRRIFSK